MLFPKSFKYKTYYYIYNAMPISHSQKKTVNGLSDCRLHQN